MKNAYVFLADGFEEIEGLTAVDLLRRADVQVSTVSVSESKSVLGAHGIRVEADLLFDEIGEVELLVLPGGMPGTLNLQAHEGLRKLIEEHDSKRKPLAAICAAPSILGQMGLLKGRRACCYPSFEEKLIGAEVVSEPSVTDGHIITGRGLGTAIPFALDLIAMVCGEDRAQEVARSIVYR